MTEELRMKLRRDLLKAFVEPERVLEDEPVDEAAVVGAPLNRARTRNLVNGSFLRLLIGTKGDLAFRSEERHVAAAEEVRQALKKVIGEQRLGREDAISVLAALLASQILA